MRSDRKINEIDGKGLMRDRAELGHGTSFEKFYLRHVAIGEGCGCAESVIKDVQGLSKPRVSLKLLLMVLWARLRGRSSAIKIDPAQSE